MKQKEFEILAEWYGQDNMPEYMLLDWQPDKDSNQLDMLEDKMIEELETLDSIEWAIDNIEGVDDWAVIYQDNFQVFTQGYGKTKNGARLDAIINYI